MLNAPGRAKVEIPQATMKQVLVMFVLLLCTVTAQGQTTPCPPPSLAGAMLRQSVATHPVDARAAAGLAWPWAIAIDEPRDIVSLAGNDSAAEPNTILAIDPKNPRRMLGAISIFTRSYPVSGHQHGIDGSADIYLTNDGGVTWSRTLRTGFPPRQTDGLGGADPAVTFANDGTALVGEMFSERSLLGFSVWRSIDGGNTWSGPVVIKYPGVWDRIFMLVDHSPISRYRGRIYLAGIGVGRYGVPTLAKGKKADFIGDKNDELVVYTSDDAGRSFQGPFSLVLPVNRHGEHMNEFGYPGQYALLADGTLLASWIEGEKGWHRFMFARSRDGGRQFDKPLVLGKTDRSEIEAARDDKAHPNRRLPEIFIPALAADTSNGPLRNSVYSVWLDYLNGQARLVSSVSRDGGVTWDALRVISDELPLGTASEEWGPHVLTPKLDVNQEGVVGLYYYAQKGTSAEWWPTFQASWDGGISWSAARSVLPSSYDPTAGNLQPVFTPWKGTQRLQFESRSRLNKHMCALGMVSDPDGLFSLMTIDTRDRELHYGFVNVRAEGTVTPRKLIDDQVELNFRESQYDQERQELSVAASIKNITQHPIAGPISLQLDRPQDAEAGESYNYGAVNADNGRTASALVWNFDVDAATGGEIGAALAPGAETSTRVLRFNHVRAQPLGATQGLVVHVYEASR